MRLRRVLPVAVMSCYDTYLEEYEHGWIPGVLWRKIWVNFLGCWSLICCFWGALLILKLILFTEFVFHR